MMSALLIVALALLGARSSGQDVHSASDKIYGRVIAAEDSQPIVGARVQPMRHHATGVDGPPQSLSTELDRLVMTDERGEFEIATEDLAGGTALFQADGRGPALARLAPEFDAPERRLVVRLARAARLVGTVDRVLEGERAPILGFVTERERLVQGGSTPALGPDVLWTVRVRGDARFEIDGLPAGVPLRVSATIDGRDVLDPVEPIVLRPGEEQAVKWQLRGGAVVRGTALDAAGNPQADVELWLLAVRSNGGAYLKPYEDPVRRVSTDALGRFVIEDVAAGNWKVGPAPLHAFARAHATPDEPAPAPVAFAVRPDDVEVDVVVPIHRGLRITGQVLDPEGQPLMAAGITVRAVDGESSLTAMSLYEGRFALEPIAPGRYALSAMTTSERTWTRSAVVEAQAGDTDVVLRIRRGGRIEGRLLDAVTGQPTGDRVNAQHLASDNYTMVGCRVEDGFSVDGIPAGSHHLYGWTRDGRVGLARSVQVDPGASITGVDIPVAPGGRLLVSYSGPLRYAYYDLFFGDVQLVQDGLITGTTDANFVPAGEVTVRFVGYRRSPAGRILGTVFERERTLQVGVGEDVLVAFEFDD